MATVEEMLKLGYTPKVKRSSTDQILGFLQGAEEQAVKQQQKEKEDVMEQVKLYGLLREQGYSEADAHKRVSRVYRSTSFVEKLLGGEGNAFQQPPEGQDKAAVERRKTEADIGKTESETKKNVASAGYYDRGGAKGMNYDKFSPNQIQTRIKYLRENELEMGVRDDAEIEEEISYLTDLFNKKSGFKQGAAPASGTPGAEEKVPMTGPDGKQYRILKSKVETARKNGFK